MTTNAQTEAQTLVVQVVHEVNGAKPGGHQRAVDIIAAALVARDAALAEAQQRYVDANEARLDALRLMRLAHAVMRETGWHVAAPVGPTSDGVLEAACNEMEADFAEFLKENDHG